MAAAVPHATFGLFCENQPIGQATFGLFCDGVIPVTEQPGGGGVTPAKRKPTDREKYYQQALREDQEFMEMLPIIIRHIMK